MPRRWRDPRGATSPRQPPMLKLASAAMLTMSESLAPERNDLHRLFEADDQRPDHGGAAKLLQHAGRDRGGVERRHDQHIGGVGEAAEGIGGHQLAVERDVGAHFAVIFEIDALRVENAHRLLHAQRALAGRMAEVGEGEHRDARLIAEPARDARRLDRDLREILGVGHFGDRGVGDHDRAAARQHQRDADHAMAGLVVDDAPHLFERDREIARHAGHHRVGVALRDHRRGEVIAVLVDHPLAVAEQEAAALQPLVEELRVERVALREPRVVDLDALLLQIEAGLLGDRAHALLAADQDRRAEALA